MCRGGSLVVQAEPVAAGVAVAGGLRSAWLTVRAGDRLGVEVSNARPAFPPRIDRLVELSVDVPVAQVRDVQLEVAMLRPWAGDGLLGMHVTLGVPVLDLDLHGPLRTLMVGLGTLLGAGGGLTGERRVHDLRLVTEPSMGTGAEVRLWSYDAP